jgi:hypothetical protein
MQEMLDKRGNVLLSISQERLVNCHDIQTVIQVLSKLILLNCSLQIPRSRGHESNVYGYRGITAQSFNRAFLNSPPQLGLEPGRQVSYFIQEHRASARFFEATDTLRGSIRESASRVQIAPTPAMCHESKCIIYLDERALGARAVLTVVLHE